MTKYSYDARNRLVRQDNPDGTFLAYSYDANGNITQRSTPAGTVAYAYDGLNRLVSVTGTDGKQTSYTYDANGNRIKTTLPNGTEADYSYDPLNHLTKVEHRTTATQAVIRGYAYTLNPNGQRAQVQEYDAAGTMTTRTYTYDSLNRLTGDVLTDSRTPANSSTIAYTYGDTGNRATKTVTQGGVTTITAYTYDADDRLTSEANAAGTTTYAWDANGNLIQKTEPTQTTLYTWDSNNRLQSVARGGSASTATTVATYQYDANGNRVGKTLADGTKITYLMDGNFAYAQVASETDTSPTGAKTETDYLYGLERIQQTRAGQGTYYHDDGLGSTRVLTDQSGNVTDSYEYDDYGALQSHAGNTKNDFMYAGEQFDVEANLSYNRARYLDVNVGRFTARDPYAGNLSQPITLNKYAYADADPVNGRDPSGRVMTIGQLNTAIVIAITLTAMVAMSSSGNSHGHGSESPLVGGPTPMDPCSTLGFGCPDDGSGEGTPNSPGRVQSRINIQNGDSNAGWQHVLKRHFSPNVNASQFSISESELKTLLQSEKVVSSPVTKMFVGDDVGEAAQLRYVRTVDVETTIGTDKFAGGAQTSQITVITDGYGNLVTCFPGALL